MNIAVFGCGYVGGTVANWLESQKHTVYRIDPKLYPDTDVAQALMECSHIIIAVPTPMQEDGTCDDSVVLEILRNDHMDYRHKILLKSTVTPDLINNYPAQVCVSPEFLRARYAKQDFENSEVLVIGHHDNVSKDADEWIELFSPLGCHVTKCSRETASLIKYTHNAWLATKNMITNIPYKGSRLTSDGFAVAARIKRRQYLLEILLSEIIGYDGDVTAAACELEHSINDNLEASIDRILGYPDRTRDGQRIPLVEREVRVFSQDLLLPAANLPDGETGTIELIVLNQTDNKTLEKLGICIGSSIKRKGEKFVLGDKDVQLSNSIASGIITRTKVV